MKDSKMRNWIMLIGFLAVIILIIYMSGGGDNGTRVNIMGSGSANGSKSVEYLIKEGMVDSIYYNNGIGKIRVKDSDIKIADFPKNSDYYFTYVFQAEIQYIFDLVKDYNLDVDNDLKPEIVGPKIEWISEMPSQSWFEAALPYLSIIFILILGYFLIKSIGNANSKSMNFGRTKARLAQNIKVRFSDVAGIDEEKEEVEEIVEFLKSPQKFTELGAKIPKGILLVGPPGTGKTLLAKAIAGESNVPFLSISGSDFVEMFVGVGASRVRDLFEQAKRNAPCIVFIDEIDAVGRQRGAGLGGGNDEREQTLNQLLVQMDGFESNEGIIVMAATNRSDVLDPALLRPGRFDRQIMVYPPDVKGREMILRVHAKNKPLDSSVDFKNLARLTSGFTGADIENLLNEAAILAAKKNRKKISMVDITEGINKVLMGPQKKSRILTENDKRITAYHEAGHAILGKKLKNCDVVQEVSIIPRGMAGGYTLFRPDNDEKHLSYNKCIDMITMGLGGRIAEELCVKEIHTGAQQDIQQATELAHKMVTVWGMSELGPVNYGSTSEIFVGRNYQTQVNYSEKKASEIDEQVSKIINSCLKTAKDILGKHIKELDIMMEILLEKETIYKDEVDMIMSGKTKEQIIKVMEENEKRTKIQQDLERALAEFEKAQKEQTVRIKTAEALRNAGVIDPGELEKIKNEATLIIAAAKDKYEVLVTKQEIKEQTKEKETSDEKPAEENKAAVKEILDNKQESKKTARKEVKSAKKNKDDK